MFKSLQRFEEGFNFIFSKGSIDEVNDSMNIMKRSEGKWRIIGSGWLRFGMDDKVKGFVDLGMGVSIGLKRYREVDSSKHDLLGIIDSNIPRNMSGDQRFK